MEGSLPAAGHGHFVAPHIMSVCHGLPTHSSSGRFFGILDGPMSPKGLQRQ